MSTLTRSIRNAWRIGFKEYLKQMNSIGDTKYGRLVGVDRFGNKYFENYEEELPLRTRWIEYTGRIAECADVEPGWHAWLHYMNDKPPTEDPVLAPRTNPWSPPTHVSTQTMSRGAYKPYSTVKPNRVQAWTPHVAQRGESSA